MIFQGFPEDFTGFPENIPACSWDFRVFRKNLPDFCKKCPDFVRFSEIPEDLQDFRRKNKDVLEISVISGGFYRI